MMKLRYLVVGFLSGVPSKQNISHADFKGRFSLKSHVRSLGPSSRVSWSSQMTQCVDDGVLVISSRMFWANRMLTSGILKPEDVASVSGRRSLERPSTISKHPMMYLGETILKRETVFEKLYKLTSGRSSKVHCKGSSRSKLVIPADWRALAGSQDCMS